MAPAFCTIGHSNRSFADFASLLQEADATALADVRTFPRSRTNPQFNIDVLPGALEGYQIAYRQFPDLGGRRPVQHEIDDSVNALWRNRSFHNYADFALGPEFAAGIADLIAFAEGRRVAVMCSEAVWWRCHRRIIADYLLARGFDVTHALGPGNIRPATMTPGAIVRDAGAIIYPSETVEEPAP